MEFFSQLVCFSKFYVGTDFFSKKLPKQHLFGILVDKSENWLYKDSKLMYFIGILGLMTRNISNISENFAI